jgi:hypothetical protein
LLAWCVPQSKRTKDRRHDRRRPATIDSIAENLRGKRDRAVILVRFNGALRRSEPIAIRVERLEKTDHGWRSLQTKCSQTEAVIVALPYGQTEPCPMRGLTVWLVVAGISDGSVFRRIWLPARGELPPDGRHRNRPPPSPKSQNGARSPTSSTRARSLTVLAGATSPATTSNEAQTSDMDCSIHPAKLNPLGRHKSILLPMAKKPKIPYRGAAQRATVLPINWAAVMEHVN